MLFSFFEHQLKTGEDQTPRGPKMTLKAVFWGFTPKWPRSKSRFSSGNLHVYMECAPTFPKAIYIGEISMKADHWQLPLGFNALIAVELV